MPTVLRKIGSFIWWVIRLGGVAGAIRDIYQVIAYLAAYGPAFLVAAVLSTLDFAAQMPPLLRLAFFVGVFFCTLAATGTAVAFGVSRLFPQQRGEKPESTVPRPAPADTDSPPAASSGGLRAWPPTIVKSTDERPLIEDDELSHRSFRQRSVWIGEYARKIAPSGDAQAIIRDRVFYDCDIYGPVALGPLSRNEMEKVFVNCDWKEGEATVPWTPAENRQEYVGAVRLENCRFEGCRISRVGILRKEEPSPAERLRDHEKRVSLKNALVAAHNEGLSLRESEFSQADAERWVSRTYDLIEAALGRKEADAFPLGSPFVYRDKTKSVELYYLDVHLERLSKLIERVDSLEPLEVQADFDSQDFQERRSGDE